MAHPDFQSLVDLAPVLIWAGDVEGNCTFLNQRWRDFTGQGTEQSLGFGFLQAIHPDDRNKVMEAFHNALQTSSSYQVEYRVQSRSGEYHWMIDSAAPHFDASGRLIGYVGALTDNSQLKAAASRHEAMEQRLDIATQAAGLGIWEWDVPARTFALSPQAKEIFGFRLDEEPSFDEIARRIHPEDQPSVEAQSARALDPAIRSREPYRYRLLRDDGAIRWIEAHGEAQFEEHAGHHTATRYIGTFQDVTEEVETEQAIHQSEERLRLALESGGIAVWELDLATNEFTHSPELNRLYGFAPDERPSAEELISRYAPGERERMERLWREALESGNQILESEVRHLLPDGTVRWLLIRAQTAAPAHGSGPRIIGIALDVTQRRKDAERLTMIARELQHRVKNSLAIIQTIAQQTFKGGRADPDALQAFNGRLQALAAATDVITRENWKKTTVQDIVDQVLSPYRQEHEDQFSIIGDEVTIDSKLAVSFALALHELATNAAKYGALSALSGKISLSWARQEQTVQMNWHEEGGPPVQQEPKAGFGTRLLQRGLFAGHDGTVRLDFAQEGLRAVITARLAA